MKTFIIFLSFLFLVQIAHAQYIPISLEQKVSSSDLIVEGEVTFQETFKSEDGYILTRNKIIPKKILKGNTDQSQSIEIITFGGESNGIQEDWTHLLKLKSGDYGIFFLTEKRKFGENAFEVFSSGQGFIKFDRFGQTPSASDYINDYQNIESDVYSSIYALTNSKLNVAKDDFSSIEKPNCLKIAINPLINQIGEIQNMLEFTVSSAMADEPLYLKNFKLSVSYNPIELGENVVTNGLISISAGNELSSTQYGISIVDIEEDVFEINISSFSNQDQYLLLDEFFKEILKIQVNFPTGIFLPEFSISENQVAEHSNFISPWTSTEERVHCVEIDFPFQLPVVCPIITGFTPDTVAAGVEDASLNGISGIVRITGSNFGNPSTGFVKPHLSDVRFNDVDSGWFSAAELEYISWTDSEIIVRVPTMRKNGGTFISPGACTERIGIFTTDFISGDTCTTYSTDRLFVRFGVFNNSWRDTILNWEISQGVFVDTIVHGGSRRNLVERNSNGGYNLLIQQFYSDVAKNNAALDQTLKALDIYRCNYKINVEVTASQPNALIRKASLPTGVTGTTFMRGNSNSLICSSTTNDDSPVSFFEVLVNEDVLDTLVLPGGATFMFNLSDAVPSDTASISYIDFQKTMIHELGHAFQLRHTNNVGDMMAAGKIDEPKFNNFNRTLSPNDDLAIKHIHLLSKIGTCIYGPTTDYICATSTVEIEGQLQDVLIFPNPAQNNVSIRFEKEIYNSQLQIVSMDGKVVFEIDDLNSQQNDFNIELPYNIENGLYIIRIKENDGKTNLIAKLIVQK